ncbi:MAG: MFS transporter [Lachnospiraceae bacterium]|nr:MFS transporter [Lachnospiraceae bacterium]
MEQKLFSKDFTLVVIGQIISLFGNAAIRFALPLYLLNQTGSSALYGTVTACAFVPAILLSPVGGIVADRVNKRNIMVILDFFTAGVIAVFSLLMGTADLVLLTTVVLMLLYGISGAYQPSVQASIPVLVTPEHSMAANSVVNTISSFASLMGPVLGGILYSTYGLKPVLRVCTACFVLSAAMEIFIKIPFIKPQSGGGIWQMVKGDFAESIRFIRKEKPIIGKALLVVCGINLFLSSMLTVGLPYMVTEVLYLDGALANKLYGLAEGALAAGGLAGGISAGVFAKKLSIQKAGNLIIASAVSVFPAGLALLVFSSGMLNYIILTVCCFCIMLFSTVFAVQMLSFFQTETPQSLVGKVIAVILAVSMCAQPLGNVVYGILFEICRGYEFAVILFAGAISLVIAVRTKGIFSK